MMKPKDRKLIREKAGVDKVTFKADGTIEFRDSYFYHMGRTPEKMARRLERTLTKLLLIPEIVETSDEWRAWPKTSYLMAKMRVTKNGSFAPIGA